MSPVIGTVVKRKPSPFVSMGQSHVQIQKSKGSTFSFRIHGIVQCAPCNGVYEQSIQGFRMCAPNFNGGGSVPRKAIDVPFPTEVVDVRKADGDLPVMTRRRQT